MRYLRIAATAAVLAILVACGGEPTKPKSGTLVFRADAACPAGTVELTVDDVVKGQYAMSPGNTVQSFTVTAGNHSAEARMVSGGGTWPKIQFVVPAEGTYTLNMTC